MPTYAGVQAQLDSIDQVIKLKLEVCRLTIAQSTLQDGLQELYGTLQKLPAWKQGMTTQTEKDRARIDTLEQRNSLLEKLVTTLELTIDSLRLWNDSTDIETTPM